MQTVSETNPRQLVDRIRRTDRDAERILVEGYGRAVAMILRRASSQAEVVQDLYQETFRLVLEKLRRGDIREPEKLAAFIAGIARNVSSDHRRREIRRKTDAASDFLAHVPDTAPGQLGRLLRSERAALVRETLAELPTERDRQLISSFYLAEQDKESICAELGLSSRHFDRVLFRARQRYKREYVRRASQQGQGV